MGAMAFLTASCMVFLSYAGVGQYSIVPDLEISPFSREKMEITYRELVEERDSVKHLL